MPTKTRSGGIGKTLQKTSSFVFTAAPVKKKRLRNMILPSNIGEEKEEEEIEVPFVRKTKDVEVGSQKVVEGFIHRGAQFIISVLLEKAKDQPATPEA